MTNTIAIWLGGLIVGFFILDALILHLDAHLYVMRAMLDLIRWVAFWR